MNFLYSLTVAFFLTVAIIPLIGRFASRLGLVDQPVGGRKLHKQPIPRTGGLGIILGASIPLLFLLPHDSQLISLLQSCSVVVLFGLLDDRFELSYQWKLFGQSLAAVIAMPGGHRIVRATLFRPRACPGMVKLPTDFFVSCGRVDSLKITLLGGRCLI